MAKYDYLFVDESGDPGFTLHPVSGELLSSAYYVAAALHLTDDAFRDLNRHVAAFRYYSGLHRELKIRAQRVEYTRLLDPIRAMSEGGRNICASVVYVDKRRYSGTYLKPGGRRPASPLRFRNYILRRLLEHHFLRYSLQSNQYDLVLDRIGPYLGGSWELAAIHISQPQHPDARIHNPCFINLRGRGCRSFTT